MKKHKYVKLGMCMLLASVFAGCNDDLTIDNVNYPSYELTDSTLYSGYKLVWSEYFDEDGFPSADEWGYEEGYRRNSEWQDYKKENLDYSYVKNGSLFLKATYDPHAGTNPWTNEPYYFDYSSASLTTEGKMPIKYGRVDIVAKVPHGKSLIPSFWLQPYDNVYGTDASISIMEYYVGKEGEPDTIKAAIQTANAIKEIKYAAENKETKEPLDLTGEWHLYSLVWTVDEVSILFDNEIVLSYAKGAEATSDDWPFDQSYSLLLSFAVGGNKGGENGSDSSIFPKEVEIDCIRYYMTPEDVAAASVPDGGNTDDEGDGNEDGGDEGDGGDEETETPNLIENGDFEVDTEIVMPGKTENGIVSDADMAGDKYVSSWDKWNAKAWGTSLVREKENGNGILRFISDNPRDRWQNWVRYPTVGPEPGMYTLSFRIKSATPNSSFSACVGFCKTSADYEFKDDKGKVDVIVNQASIYIKDNGQQEEMPASGNPVYPVFSGELKDTQWQEFSVDFEVKEKYASIMLIFAIDKDWNGNGYTAPNPIRNIDYSFDDISLKKKK